ncbi:MAG: amino acid permease [archaeon]|nr:APC family permease [Candidatus Micrarchaeota archaeon]
MLEKIRLKRELGLLEAVLCGIGIILGAGIYVLIGEAAGVAGNAIWLSFLIAAVVAAFTGLSYAELASLYPKAGAEFEYTKHSFGKRIGFIVGWMTIVAGIISAATVGLGFGGYFEALTGIPVAFGAIGIIALSSFIVFYGIKQSAWIAGILTVIETLGLLIIIFIGLPYIGSVNLMEFPETGFTGILTASALIFFAFIGFEEIVRMSEETRNAEKVIPKALMISIIITSIIYVLVAVVAVSVVPWNELAESSAPLADVAAKALGSEAFLILGIIALFSTANTVLLILLATSRIVYGIGEDEDIPHIVAKIHPKTRTPYIAIALVFIATVIFVFLGRIDFVAYATDYVLFLVFIVINAAVIAMRFKEPNTVRPFRIPFNIGRIPVTAVLGIITCIVLIGQILQIHLDVIITSSVIIVIGLAFYEVARIRHHKGL